MLAHSSSSIWCVLCNVWITTHPLRWRFATLSLNRTVRCTNLNWFTDEDHLTYRTTAQPPTIHPDGVSDVGWVYFGPSVRKYSHFGKYWSCSEFLVKGDHLLTSSHAPIFRPVESISRVTLRMKQTGMLARTRVPKFFKYALSFVNCVWGTRPIFLVCVSTTVSSCKTKRFASPTNNMAFILKMK